MAKSVIELNIKQTVDGKESVTKLTADFQELQSALQKTQASIKSVQDVVGQGLATCATFSTSLQALSSSVGQLAQGYNDYDKAMRAVNTMAGKNEEGFANLKGQVSELAKTIPLAKDQLANGLYQVISNGVPEDNWISYLEASAKASVGGIADLGQTVTVTSTLIKNYGLAWDQAGTIQDKIQLTAKNGVTSFEQLAGALPKVAGSAATLGISIDELMASFATLTGVSGSTDEVATQLVAVMSALTKPTSEASKLAEEMGIQFNAAAIKAAGGMQQFLSQLVVNVKQYAQETGQLETEIYSTLFGSSRAIRGLIPLTGELAEKFKSNISEMSNSAGTIDGAFENMSSTSEAVTQKIKNQMSAVTGMIGQYAAAAQPMLQYAAILGQSIAGVTAMCTVITALITKTKALTTAMIGERNIRILTIINHKVERQVKEALIVVNSRLADSVRAVSIATKVLYATVSLGLTLAISALIELIARWTSANDDAAASTNNLTGISERFKDKVSDTTSELESAAAHLKSLMDAHLDTASAVEHLNQTYGSIFNTYKTAAEWYQVLTQNSKIYAKQLGYEAAAKEYSAEKARKEAELDDKKAQARALLQSGKAEIKHYGKDGAYSKVVGEKADEYKALDKEITQLSSEVATLDRRFDGMMSSAANMASQIRTNINALNAPDIKLSWDQQSIEELKKTIESQTKKVERLGNGNNPEAKEEAALLAKMKQRLATLQKIYGLSTKTSKVKTEKYNGDKYIKDADDLKELENNLKYYDNAIAKADSSDKEHIRTLQNERNQIESQIADIKLLYEELGLPVECKSLSDFDKWLSHLNSACSVASAEELPALKKKIEEVQAARDEFEDAAEPVINIKDIKSYDELDKAISRVDRKTAKATKEGREALIKERKELERLRQEWEDLDAELSKPGEISQINNLRDLAAAETYYNNLRERGNADEIANAHEMLRLIEQRRKALTIGETISDYETEVNDVGKYGEKQMKIEIKAIGIDGVKDKILELNKLLADGNLTDEQEKRVRKLISTYEGWRKSMALSFDTLKDGYGNIKSVGNALISMHDTLTESGTAWEKITGLIDAFISLYEGINGIIKIIDELASVTKIYTAAETAEAAATETATAATAEGAQVKVAAAAEETAAASTVTTAEVAEAGAKTMAAHASIPWVGIAIAGGLIASMIAIMKGLPKFANGGIAYGPTLGLFGEYSGASNNPEVVAPLDKLRDLIEPRTAFAGGKVEFEIKGRKLVGVLNKQSKYSDRI
jgi:TP901 family phage tail tape measure protein